MSWPALFRELPCCLLTTILLCAQYYRGTVIMSLPPCKGTRPCNARAPGNSGHWEKHQQCFCPLSLWFPSQVSGRRINAAECWTLQHLCGDDRCLVVTSTSLSKHTLVASQQVSFLSTFFLDQHRAVTIDMIWGIAHLLIQALGEVRDMNSDRCRSRVWENIVPLSSLERYTYRSLSSYVL